MMFARQTDLKSGATMHPAALAATICGFVLGALQPLVRLLIDRVVKDSNFADQHAKRERWKKTSLEISFLLAFGLGILFIYGVALA